jgi:hypothetical protein
MAIRMQGSWTVSVKSRNAALPQRFIIQGASSGNGTYTGAVATPPVFVTGPDWTIRVQNNPGAGWIDSDDQITFPTTSAGQQRFDIQTNDSGADSDFDDLILTCAMPISATDFLIYGHASSYEGICILNPCFPRFVVIDSELTLAAAIKYPKLKEVIRKFYPERLKPQPPNPPDPPPFRPMIISLEGDTPIPPKQNLQIGLRRVDAAADPKVKGAVAPRLSTITSITKSDVVQRASSSRLDSVAIGTLADRLRFRCSVESLAGVVLRFQEYDRTGSELAGGVYTGAGLRENLGVTVTDRNGNYIFRFTRSIPEFFDEGALDTGSGEITVTQSAPDIIVQLIDVMAPGTVLWESAPYFNIPPLRRINVCIPKGRLHPTRCVAGQIIQAVGNVFVGPPPAGPRPFGEPPGYGQRVGFNNAIGLRGRVTARNTSGPQTRCAAWRGTLDLFGCFLDHPSVTHYTIRYREFGVSAGWTLFSQELRHPLISKAGLPGYNGELVGPHTVNLHLDGGPAVLIPSYLNIESDVLYVSTHRDRRAQIRSWLLSVPMPGPVQFRIEGYDGAGNRVAGAEDSVTLFIDNSGAFVDIDDVVTMGSATLGNCAKFKLPAGSPGAPLTVKFKADQAQGFLSTYELFMQKGAIGSFAVQPPPPAGAPFRLQSYTHGDDLACSELQGTFDDPTHDLSTGYVTVDLTPASGHWLESTETFCAFSLNLNATTRVTDGYGGGDSFNAVPVLIGIEA